VSFLQLRKKAKLCFSFNLICMMVVMALFTNVQTEKTYDNKY